MAGFFMVFPASKADASDNEGPRFNADVETWGYYSRDWLVKDSILNPDNLSNLPTRRITADVRINATVKGDSFDILLRPRLFKEVGHVGGTRQTEEDAYFSQGFARFRLPYDFTVTLGRELLTWGPANFRSPSNPFYFDPGRTQPLREVSGLDLARVHYLAGRLGVTAAHIFRDKTEFGFRDPQTSDVESDSKKAELLKFDYRGSNYLLSAIASKRTGERIFGGAFAQATLNDAVLAYGEFGSVPGRRIQDDATGALKDVPRASTWLGGLSYTLASGKVASIEYLRDNRGFTEEEESAFFSQVQQRLSQTGTPASPTAIAATSNATSTRSSLLGRDYVSLVFQSDLQQTSPYWRATVSRNIHDRSTQAIIYLESKVSDRFSVFGSVWKNFGDADTEFGSVVRSEVILGIKAFAF